MSVVVLVPALTASLIGLIALVATDPKHLRQRQGTRPAHNAWKRLRPASARRRGLLWALVLAPGLWLAAVGHWSGFLIWFGAAIAGGWLLVQCLASDAGGDPVLEADLGSPPDRLQESGRSDRSGAAAAIDPE